MGQYLAIGITTRLSVRLIEPRYKVEEPAVRAAVMRHLPDLSIFDNCHPWDGTSLTYELKAPIWESGLIELLEEVYPRLRGSSDGAQDSVLNALRSTAPQDWVAVAKSGNNGCFFLDHPFPDTELLDASFRPRVELTFEMVGLFLEGKMMAECWKESFRFFQYCIGRTFSEHALAKALRVYFSG